METAESGLDPNATVEAAAATRHSPPWDSALVTSSLRPAANAFVSASEEKLENGRTATEETICRSAGWFRIARTPTAKAAMTNAAIIHLMRRRGYRASLDGGVSGRSLMNSGAYVPFEN